MNKNKSTESMSDHNKIVEGAELNGNLQSPGDIRVDGKVKGLHKTARIQAELTTEKLAIEPGAQFTGTCQMGSSKAMNQSQPQDQQARTGTQTSASVS
jgi:cytoskeletal protein CcmA (bactofilin family)